MHRAVPKDMPLVGWTVVAIGALCLAVVVLKYAPSNRSSTDRSTGVVGVALVLCAIGAALRVVTQI